MTWDELLQKVLDAPNFKQLEMAKEASKIVLGYMTTRLDKASAMFLYSCTVSTFIGADGVISKPEYDLFCSIFEVEIPLEGLSETIKAACTKENIQVINEVIDSSPAEVKLAFVMLGAVFCSCDGVITPEEQELLSKYLK